MNETYIQVPLANNMSLEEESKIVKYMRNIFKWYNSIRGKEIQNFTTSTSSSLISSSPSSSTSQSHITHHRSNDQESASNGTESLSHKMNVI